MTCSISDILWSLAYHSRPNSWWTKTICRSEGHCQQQPVTLLRIFGTYQWNISVMCARSCGEIISLSTELYREEKFAGFHTTSNSGQEQIIRFHVNIFPTPRSKAPNEAFIHVPSLPLLLFHVFSSESWKFVVARSRRLSIRDKSKSFVCHYVNISPTPRWKARRAAILHVVCLSFPRVLIVTCWFQSWPCESDIAIRHFLRYNSSTSVNDAFAQIPYKYCIQNSWLVLHRFYEKPWCSCWYKFYAILSRLIQNSRFNHFCFHPISVIIFHLD